MNLFEHSAVQEVLARLNTINANTPANWGKMNAAQMVAHCQATFQAYFGEIKMKRALIGRFFGKIAKRKLLSPKPWSRNLPTAREFKISNERNFEKERQKLIGYINRFVNEGYTITATKHPFFGEMSSQEWATLAYKHLDHHLRQFGA